MFFFISKEIKLILNNYQYYLFFHLLYLILICIFVFIIGDDLKYFSNIGIYIITFNIFIIALLSSSYMFSMYNNNGFTELLLLSKLNYSIYLVIKSFIYWLFVLLPLCFVTIFNLILLNIFNLNIFFILLIYSLSTLIIIYTNSIINIIILNYKYNNIIIFVLNVILNIPTIILNISIIKNYVLNINYDIYINGLIGLLIIVFILGYLCSSIIYYYIIK
jgi:heme exporter protein CcmB